MISLVSLVTAAGPYRADWNETHVKNPAWPPHAKFHNGQTMSLGLALGVTSLWQLWRAPSARESLDAGAALASLYWLTQISALAYPGSKAVDPPGDGEVSAGGGGVAGAGPDGGGLRARTAPPGARLTRPALPGGRFSARRAASPLGTAASVGCAPTLPEA